MAEGTTDHLRKPGTHIKDSRRTSRPQRSPPSGFNIRLCTKATLLGCYRPETTPESGTQIREADTWDHIVQLAERYDATMYKTGPYRGKGGNQNTGKRMQAPKRQLNTDVTNRTPAKGKGKGKAPAKRKPTQKNQKPTKAEME